MPERTEHARSPRPAPGPQSARPPRPHRSLTDDGRTWSEVLSYSRRGSRMTPRQAEGWEAHAHEWFVPDEDLDDPGFSFTDAFARRAPLLVEVGCGIGEATAPLAAARPDHDVLAFEVWKPGVADTLRLLGEVGATNVRLCSVDAVWCLRHLVEPASVEEVWTFFPDPWHKTRHHKRRIVDADFAALVASRLVPGGRWRLATDWAEYADQMRVVLDAEPALAGGVVERWADRPVTRFERKGLEAGRTITDLAYTRVGDR